MNTADPLHDDRILIGHVQRIFPDKGYGFVRLEGDEKAAEYFFHRSASPAFDDLQAGHRVSFRWEVGHKGLRAFGVEVVERG